MKINEIIHKKRLEQGLTQEQIANSLGVSIPAVNKWEKGKSYPDITLLPPLARLLNTDLNTLLSFQEDLSEKEVALMINKVSEIFEKQGYEAGFEKAIHKIKEFPNCNLLIVNMATLLDGGLILYGKDINKDDYEEVIVSLYEKVAKSNDMNLREQAQSQLIHRLMQNNNYDKAQEILDTFSAERFVDKKQIQAKLYIAKGELDKAAKLTEEKLLSTTNDIHTSLMTLMEIAIQEDRIDDGNYIADVDKKVAQLFDLWEYNQYVAHYQLHEALGNKAERIQLLLPMLKSLTKKWDIHKSPLYRHIQKKEIDKKMGPKFQKAIIQSIDSNEEMTYLKDNSEIKDLMKQLNIE